MKPYHLIFCAVLVTFCISTALSQNETNDSILKNKTEHFKMSVGFTHLVNDTYRSAINGKEFGFCLGYRPKSSFIEILAKYEFSNLRVDSTDINYEKRNDKPIHFTSLCLSLQKHFIQERQSAVLSFYAGPVMVNIGDENPKFGFTAGFSFEYLFKVDVLGGRMGIFVDIKSNQYNLSGKKAAIKDYIIIDHDIIERDANTIVGFVFRY